MPSCRRASGVRRCPHLGVEDFLPDDWAAGGPWKLGPLCSPVGGGGVNLLGGSGFFISCLLCKVGNEDSILWQNFCDGI